MENVIDKETEKEIVALVEKYNESCEIDDNLDNDETESDKLFAKIIDFLYEKLKNKRFIVTEAYSIDKDDVEEIISTFGTNTSKDLNKIIYNEVSDWYTEKNPLSIKYEIV